MTLSVMVGIGAFALVLVLLVLAVVTIHDLRIEHTTDGKDRPDRDDSWKH
jgi:hypothetical protein